MVKFLYAGFECEAAKCWKDYTVAPAPHGGIKDPDKQDAWLREKWLKLEAEAGERPLSGHVKRAMLSFDPTDGNTTNLFDGLGADCYCELDKLEVGNDRYVIFGLNVSSRIRQCAIDEAILNRAGPSPGSWGIMGTYSDLPMTPALRFVDPLHAIMGGADVEGAAVIMMKFLELRPMELGKAFNQMTLCHKLVDRFRLTRPAHYEIPPASIAASCPEGPLATA